MNVALTVRIMVRLNDNENTVISCFLVNSYNSNILVNADEYFM